jgi:hypothetical protein
MQGKVSVLAVALIGASVPTEAAKPLPFLCAVSGSKMLKPRLSPDDICARFKRGIEAALKTPMQPVAALPATVTASTRWIKVDVTFKKPGVASALVTQQSRGKTKTYPEMAIMVSDRVMDSGTVDRLVSEVGRAVRF